MPRAAPWAALAAAAALAAGGVFASPPPPALPGRIEFALTRRVISVEVNSTLHHRHGGDEIRAHVAAAARRAAAAVAPRAAAVLAAAPRAAQDEVPVYGDFRRLAYFFADVFIGSQPQRFTVIADTGSSLTAVPCAECGDCGEHMNPRFNPAHSSSAVALTCAAGCPGNSHCSASKCAYTQSYAEGSSLRGVLYRDVVYVGGDAPGGDAAGYAIPFAFGCGMHEGGLFVTQEADGIMGLGQSDMSITRALWDAGKLARNVFSLCLSMQGGAFALGAVDTRLHDAPLAWARMSLTGFYVVTVTGMALDATALRADRFSSPHTILDSGTTFTYVPSNTYADLRAAISAYCAADRVNRCRGTPASVSGEPLCYRLADAAAIASFPTVTLNLAGVEGVPVALTVPPQHVFINMGWDSGAYCLAIYDNGERGGVIGANAMMGHDVVFDMAGEADSGPRAGFAPSSCRMPPPGPPSPSPAPPSPSPSSTPPPAPATPSPSPSTAPLSPGASPSTSSAPLPSPAASPAASATASPAAAGSGGGGGGGGGNEVGAGGGADTPAPTPSSSSLLVAAAVCSTALLLCAGAYMCLTCECRVGRIVVRFEGKQGGRYTRVDEGGAGGGGGGSADEEGGGARTDSTTSPRSRARRAAPAAAGTAAPAPAPGAAGGGGEEAEARAAAMSKLASALTAPPPPAGGAQARVPAGGHSPAAVAIEMREGGEGGASA